MTKIKISKGKQSILDFLEKNPWSLQNVILKGTGHFHDNDGFGIYDIHFLEDLLRNKFIKEIMIDGEDDKRFALVSEKDLTKKRQRELSKEAKRIKIFNCVIRCSKCKSEKFSINREFEHYSKESLICTATTCHPGFGWDLNNFNMICLDCGSKDIIIDVEERK